MKTLETSREPGDRYSEGRFMTAVVPRSAILLAIGMLAAGEAMAIEKLAYRTIDADGPFGLGVTGEPFVGYDVAFGGSVVTTPGGVHLGVSHEDRLRVFDGTDGFTFEAWVRPGRFEGPGLLMLISICLSRLSLFLQVVPIPICLPRLG